MSVLSLLYYVPLKKLVWIKGTAPSLTLPIHYRKKAYLWNTCVSLHAWTHHALLHPLVPCEHAAPQS